MATKVFRISVPEYSINEKPNYMKIGKKVDDFIESKLSDGKYVIRAIGHQDHPNFSLNELIDVIIDVGTDKYDENRESVFDEEFSMYEYDFQAGFTEIKDSKIIENPNDDYPSCFGDIIYHFYEHAPLDRGYPVRIDLLLVYDFEKLDQGKLLDKEKNVRKELADCLWKFKDSENKKDALVAIFVIDK